MNKKRVAIALVLLNVVSVASIAYFGFRYVSESDMTHQSFMLAQQRAKLAGAVEAIPRLNSDYIDFLRGQRLYLLTIWGGFSVVLLGNTVWIFLNRKPSTTRAS
jgi:hypothetical protein